MKKILVSCDEYVYSYNGQYYLSEFGSVLVKRYLNVFDSMRLAARTKHVTSKEELGKYTFIIENNKIEIFPIPFFQGPVEYGKHYLKIKRILASVADGCDAAVFRLPSTVAFACLNHVINKKIPYGVEVVANPIEAKQSSKNIIVKALMYVWDYKLKRACRLADAVSYVTENSLQSLYPAGHNSYKTHYSSIEMDSSFFTEPRILVNNNIIRISHVSTNIKTFTKGHMTVIETVKLLKKKGFDVIAKFAGEGEYVNIFKNKAKELGLLKQIEFVGSLNRDELNEFLKKSNFMIFPSTSEGLPRVLIEAMATGLPCLSTPVGGIPELLDVNLLFNPNDAVGFAEKTAEVFSNNELYNQLSKQNYNKALEYEKNTLDKKRSKLYEHLYNISKAQ